MCATTTQPKFVSESLAEPYMRITGTDYRKSHLAKGIDYDRSLSAAGVDSYMAEQERHILCTRVVPEFLGRMHRYLDFACGTGRVTQCLARFARESYGLDVSESMIEQARVKCPKTTFLIGDITREKVAISPVSVVSAFRFFGNAQDELRRSALQAIARLLVPGGHLVINNHRNPWAIKNLLSTVRGHKHSLDLSPTKLKRQLTDAGFKIMAAYGIGFWMIGDRFQTPACLSSSIPVSFERLSFLPGVSPFCPDAIIVAKREP